MTMRTDVVALHRTRVSQMLEEAEALAGTMTKVSQVCRQTLEQGGQVSIQPQMAFAVGSLARLLKDEGVVEQLQGSGVSQRRHMS